MYFIGFFGGVCMLGLIVVVVFMSWLFVKIVYVWGYSMVIFSVSLGFVFFL